MRVVQFIIDKLAYQFLIYLHKYHKHENETALIFWKRKLKDDLSRSCYAMNVIIDSILNSSANQEQCAQYIWKGHLFVQIFISKQHNFGMDWLISTLRVSYEIRWFNLRSRNEIFLSNFTSINFVYLWFKAFWIIPKTFQSVQRQNN